MNRTHFWKILFVVFVVCWAIYEVTPPKGRNLISHFESRGQGKDEAFAAILERARALEADFKERAFGNLLEAVDTNSIVRYFPHIDVTGEKEPTTVILHRLQREAAGKIKLGLDLQGGTSFLVRLEETETDTNVVVRTEEKDAKIANAIEVLRNRVDGLGVAEPLLQPVGEDHILIQLPGLSASEMQLARETIQRAAYLEFRMVHPSNQLFMAQELIPPGYEILKEQRKERDGRKVVIPYLVNKKPELTGKYLKRAMVTRAQLTNEPEVLFELNDEGARLFADLTRKYQPQGDMKYQLAIVLDGELYSAPVINGPIEGGSGVITGSFDFMEARTLANVLENPLEAPVRIEEQHTVDPSLGKDSIRSGIQATLIGMVAVAVFMLVYYLFSGLLANVALMLNLVVLMGVLCSVDATLTLPGIAGIVLTVGMAVDANVLIFERIREEYAAGKSMRGALAAGYNKAFGTIFDSNLTTLISAVILIFMGTGPVKGFGVTLTIGIVTSVFTALVVTRLIFDIGLAKGWLKSFRMMNLIKGSKIDFLKWAKPAFAISWLLTIVGVGYGISRGSDVLSYDFTGGDNMTMTFSNKVSPDQLRSTIGKLAIGDAMIQYQKDLGTGKETLRVTTKTTVVGSTDGMETVTKVEQALKADFPEAGFFQTSLDRVGPTVGAKILKTAIVASLLALFGILIYVAFRFELSFAVAAVVAVLHDVMMTMGWFFLTGRELSAPMVAAILTIIGFSINDTIVIFDRIREDLKLGVRGTFAEVINRAVNRTLSRTVITSGTTLLTALSLYIFGGGVINDFAFTFVVGILTGTYSSIYIASALVLWWHGGNRPKTGSQVVMETAATPARV